MKLFQSVRATITLSAGVIALLLSQSASAEALRLNFGVYSSNKPSAMVRIFKPALNELEARMSEKLGREVDIRMQIAKDYDQGISHLTTGKVDFSRFGPASYIEAKKMNEGIEILAMESKAGAKVFYGIIATEENSDIKSVEDLRDRSFAFGDEGSTIGRFLSQLHLQQNSIRADDLSKYEYLGRHDLVGTAVGAGDFAAGALNESTFKKLVDAGEPIRQLAKFPNVTKPWLARANLDPVILEALQLSLLEIDSTKALKNLKIDGFLKGGDEDYAVIREAMDFNFKFFEDSVVKNAAKAPATKAIEPAAKASVNAVAKAASPAQQTTTNSVPVNTVPVTTAAIAQPKVTTAATPASASITNKTNAANEPTINAALPAATAKAVTTMQQPKAAPAAIGFANQSVASPSQSIVPATPSMTSAPSEFAMNGSNLTINIALPSQLMQQYGPNGNSQNITINLTFPSDGASLMHAPQ